MGGRGLYKLRAGWRGMGVVRVWLVSGLTSRRFYYRIK
jgi:hypothetical protein